MLFFTTKAINDTQEALRVTFCNCEKGTSACVKHQNLKIINASCKTSWKS